MNTVGPIPQEWVDVLIEKTKLDRIKWERKDFSLFEYIDDNIHVTLSVDEYDFTDFDLVIEYNEKMYSNRNNDCTYEDLHLEELYQAVKDKLPKAEVIDYLNSL